jgi:AcrR family transcriptional regulator
MPENTSQLKSDILRSVLRLEVLKGHLKWKVSDLARYSGVSRPLIYYHFGNTKAAIIVTSIRYLAEEYFGLNEERLLMFKQGNALPSLMRTRKALMAAPDAITFYFRWRTTKSEIQKHLIAIELEYQKLLVKGFPSLSAPEAAALHGILFGLVTAPFLTNEALQIAAGWIGNLRSLERPVAPVPPHARRN